MRRTVREDHFDEDRGESYFIVKIIDDDTGRTIRRLDGSERCSDSRHCKDPYAAVERPTSGAVHYSSKGIV
jgi:hypothetical protein